MPSSPSKIRWTSASGPRDPRLQVTIGLGVLWLVTACALVVTLGAGGYNLLLNRPPSAPPPLATGSLAVAGADTPLPVEAAQATSTPVVESTVATPAPAEVAGQVEPGCEESWLFVHDVVLRVESLPRNADGSVTVPADSPGVAYWLEGTPVQRAFGLSRTPENAALLAGVQVGQAVTLLWRGCVVEESTLLAVVSALPGGIVAYNQDYPGVSLFMEEGRAVAGEPPVQATVAGAPPAQATHTAPVSLEPSATPPGQTQPTPTTPPTDSSSPTSTFVPPPPPTGEIEAEIEFLAKQVSASTIMIDISVYNYGDKAFSINAADVHLISPGQTSTSPSSANPALPYQLGSSARQAFSFAFPNPGGSGLVFQIFEVEFDLDDF